MKRFDGFYKVQVAFFIGIWTLALGAVAGWVKHIVHCFQHEEWLLLIAGAIAAPMGAIHGWGLWLGWW